MSANMDNSSLWLGGISVAEQPRIEILRQPQSVYRMRYETDDRKTNLFAEELELASSSSPSDSMSVVEDNDSSDLPNSACCSSKSTEKETKRRKKEYVTVKVHNVNDPSYLLVCCVSADEPYFCHPNMLVGKNCEKGVYIAKIDGNSNTIELRDVRIQLVKKDQLKKRLYELKELKIDDPFLVKNQQTSENVDLGKIRLCFQILNNHPFENSFTPHPPVLSKPISTSKQKLSILIQYTSEMSGPMGGGNQVALLVKKLEKDQKPIMARFFDNQGWVRDVRIERVHYQCALLVTVPPYKTSDHFGDVEVNLKLFVCPEKKSLISGQFKYESNNVTYTYKSYVLSNVMFT